MARDSSGEKYLILKEMGESIDMTFGRVALDSGKVDWMYRPHNISDGVGAYTDLLNLDGNKITEQPLMKSGPIPGLLKRIGLLRQHMKNMRPTTYAWKYHDPKKRGLGLTLAYTLFDKDALKALLDYARAQKTSLNSVLLWTLNDVACETLLTAPPEETVWTIPLNLRGGATAGATSSNVTASICLRLPPNPSVSYIDTKIKTIYQQGVHWGAWLLSNMTRFIGKRGFKFLAERARPCWLGVFSNVGSWPPPNHPHPVDENIGYMGAPPATSILPITCCSMTWNNRMSLTLQLHPSISNDKADTEKMIQRWTQRLADIAGLSPEQFSIGYKDWSELEKESVQF
ncbi:MAG: hypothetical protein P1U67_10335 [Alcanivoracaceae bacterium]|nr:hypothetical protein [Alcanivoracaceae bacterium]